MICPVSGLEQSRKTKETGLFYICLTFALSYKEREQVSQEYAPPFF